ncbi:sulfurtransferase-like selenium metabolism protein YedF [bacterium]|nr:sulfurtransferase-like selenium metabolism protein YedF [bacterium]
MDSCKIVKDTINVQGMLCPKPLIVVKNYYEKAEIGTYFLVTLDSEISVLNVERYLKNIGAVYEIEEDNSGLFSIFVEVNKKSVQSENSDGYLFYIASDKMGDGDPDLGKMLLKTFITQIKNLQQLPEKVIFLNSAVLLLTNSIISDELKELESKGVEIYFCGTCSEYYSVTSEISVGKVSNMLEIMEFLRKSRVVRI